MSDMTKIIEVPFVFRKSFEGFLKQGQIPFVIHDKVSREEVEDTILLYNVTVDEVLGSQLVKLSDSMKLKSIKISVEDTKLTEYIKRIVDFGLMVRKVEKSEIEGIFDFTLTGTVAIINVFQDEIAFTMINNDDENFLNNLMKEDESE